MKPKAVIFDCFGVLYVDVSEAYFAKFPDKREELHDLNKMSDHGFIDRQTYIEAVSRLTGEPPAAVASAFQKEHVVNAALITFIKNELKPHYKIGLLSNIGRGWIQDFFDEHQLHDLFDASVLSGEEGITKPNPLIFERSAERLEVLPTECVFVDDRQENCDGATAVGMQAVHYTTLEVLQAKLAKTLG